MVSRFDWSLPVEQWLDEQCERWVHNQRLRWTAGKLSGEQISALQQLGVRPPTGRKWKRLPRETIDQIVSRVDAGETTTVIASDLGMLPGGVSLAYKRQTGNSISGRAQRPVSRTERELIVACVEAGETATAVGARLGRSGSSVANIYKATTGLTVTRHGRLTSEEELQIVRYVDSGELLVDVAEHFGRHLKTVRQTYVRVTGRLPSESRGEASQTSDLEPLNASRSATARRRERDKQIVEHLAAGAHPNLVAQQLGCGVTTVYNVYRRETGRAPRRQVRLTSPEERALIAEQMAAGMPPVIYGDGKTTRDFVYVGDVVSANVAALTGDLSGAVNIGTGVEHSVLDVVRLLAREFGFEGEPEVMPPRDGEVRRVCLDTRLARDQMQFESGVSLEDGIRKTAQYFRMGVEEQRVAKLESMH